MIRELYDLRNDRRARYLAVGAGNTFFGYFMGLFLYYLLSAYWHIIYITILSGIINISFSFATYKLLVFRTKGKWFTEYIRCYMVYGAGMLIGVFLIWVLVDILGIAFWLAQGITILSTVVFSYFGHSRFSFVRK